MTRFSWTRLNGRMRLALAGAALVATGGGATAQAPFQCPRKGGDLIFALEARVPSLDQHVSNSSATRNVAMNIFETLITRDDKMNPTLDLARSVDVSPDNKVFVFKLREGVTFHNGKAMTSADVAASFERFKRVGIDRSILDPVETWETPDPLTFTITLKESRPLFLEALSAFGVPLAIIPAENADAAAQQLPTIGTGPFRLDELRADSHVRIRRYDAYKPDTRHPGLVGFGGAKHACVDSVTFRMMTEPAARTAALEVGEVHIVEDVPAASVKRLAADRNIKLSSVETFWMQVAYPNFSFPPTNNLKVRQAILAAMDFDEIMEAATEGRYKLNAGFQFPGQAYYTEEGKELINQKNKDKARGLLAEGGYKGEKVILLTNREFPVMYNTSLVMAEQLKAVGIAAELLVLDWPAALQKSQKDREGWNFFYTGWITAVALGGQQTLRQMAEPTPVHVPPEMKVDPAYMKAFLEVQTLPTLEQRKAAFARAQRIALESVMAIPFGVAPKVQAARASVEGFSPYYNTRVSNIWLRD
jgi:peptide/nickel transport system substrate-binding protein